MKKTNKYFCYNDIFTIQPLFKDIINSFTYEFWIKPEAPHNIVEEDTIGVSGTNGQNFIIGPGYAESNEEAGVGISVATNGIHVFEHSQSYLPALLVHQTPLIDWTHIAVVYQEGIPLLYINGEFIKRGQHSSKKLVYPSGIIGGFKPYGFYIGYIKKVRLWKYAKSSKEINEGIVESRDEEKIVGDWNFYESGLDYRNSFQTSRKSLDETKNLKVLFVKSGLDSLNLPYYAIEKSIIKNLTNQVSELKICEPNENLFTISQIFHPDLVIIFNGFNVHAGQLLYLKKARIKTAVWLTDDPYYSDVTKELASKCDFVFTQEINCIPCYKAIGCQNVFYLPLAAESSIFQPITSNDNNQTDILFIGSAFNNRINFFDSIAAYLSTKNALIMGLWWEKLNNYHLLKDKIRSNIWLSPEETAKYYNGAKIVVNMHRTSYASETSNSQKIEAVSINPRTFEISSCGAFQLSDVKQGLNTFYIPEADIATYTTPIDFVKKVEYFLNNEENRKRIAVNALNKTHRNHTYFHRVKQLLDIAFS